MVPSIFSTYFEKLTYIIYFEKLLYFYKPFFNCKNGTIPFRVTFCLLKSSCCLNSFSANNRRQKYFLVFQSCFGPCRLMYDAEVLGSKGISSLLIHCPPFCGITIMVYNTKFSLQFFSVGKKLERQTFLAGVLKTMPHATYLYETLESVCEKQKILFIQL